jgi:hypothetical protein
VQRFLESTSVDLSLLSVRCQLSYFAVQQMRGSHIHFLPNAYLEGIAATICLDSACHGVMHIDACLDKSTGKVFLMECNPRSWASLTAASWCGLDFVGQSVDPRMRAPSPIGLVSGSAPRRHPLLRPSLWRLAMFDKGVRGRLLRMQLLDVCVPGLFFSELPCWPSGQPGVASSLSNSCAFRPC